MDPWIKLANAVREGFRDVRLDREDLLALASEPELELVAGRRARAACARRGRHQKGRRALCWCQTFPS